jgi:uroporphyrin-III C-methyltransferase
MTGRVYLVGAGPGAADLLTVRAARVLSEAEVVFHDALVEPEVLALSPRAEKIAVGKRCGRHATSQVFINKRLADAAQRHRIVVRIKGGDPMLFGRAHEEISYLQARGIAVEVVPGVTAALGAAAALGVSLTRRGVARSVAFATPRVGEGERASDWARAVANADTAALYMASHEAVAVRDALLAAGVAADTPAIIAAGISLPNERWHFGTLGQLAELAAAVAGAPALLLLGAVFAEAQALAGDVRMPRAASQTR